VLSNYEIAETDEDVGTRGFMNARSHRLGEKAVIFGHGWIVRTAVNDPDSEFAMEATIQTLISEFAFEIERSAMWHDQGWRLWHQARQRQPG
jgi:hypothetical protein